MSQTVTFDTTLSADDLALYISQLVNTHFPDANVVNPSQIMEHLPSALERLATCMSGIHRKYFNESNHVRFDHMNSDHMAMFLYLLGNTIWNQSGTEAIPTKLFYLNKVMNAVDLYFSVEMPEVFVLVHPVGSVIGNAHYGNYVAIYQGCTVGAVDGVYPVFGDGAILYAGATVLGETVCGDNVVFAARSFVINSNIPAQSVVTGAFPNEKISPSRLTVKARMFDPLPRGEKLPT
jgi:serine O-acetyltransferase